MDKNIRKKILILGCGAIGKCILEFFKKINTPIELKNIIIIDIIDQKDVLKSWLNQGVQFFQRKISKENFASEILNFIGRGDVLLDLSVNISSIDLAEFCQVKEIHYCNSSIECWPEFSNEISLYERQLLLSKLKHNNSISFDHNHVSMTKPTPHETTMLLDQGMNPGLVSQFMKQAILDVANHYCLKEKRLAYLYDELEHAIAEKDFSKMAYLMEIKAIHISERDSQMIDENNIREGTFYNTWSVNALIDEMEALSEIAWGTHEKQLPHRAKEFTSGPLNQILLSSPGNKMFLRSWVPSGEFIGMCARHGETYTISNFLSYKIADKVTYRPSVYFSYLPCQIATRSLLNKAKKQQFNDHRILSDELSHGADEVGCLLISPLFKGWWTGSVLDVCEAKKIMPKQNATILQVAVGVFAGLLWVLKNPNKGICLPEDLPHDEILSFAKPYLGKFYSQSVNWDYLNHIDDYQFSSFISTERKFVQQINYSKEYEYEL